jgi:hypothetical protein
MESDRGVVSEKISLYYSREGLRLQADNFPFPVFFLFLIILNDTSYYLGA